MLVDSGITQLQVVVAAERIRSSRVPFVRSSLRLVQVLGKQKGKVLSEDEAVAHALGVVMHVVHVKLRNSMMWFEDSNGVLLNISQRKPQALEEATEHSTVETGTVRCPPALLETGMGLQPSGSAAL